MIDSDKHNLVLVFGINNVHKKAYNIGKGTQNAKKNELENGHSQACQIEVSFFTRFLSLSLVCYSCKKLLSIKESVYTLLFHPNLTFIILCGGWSDTLGLRISS